MSYSTKNLDNNRPNRNRRVRRAGAAVAVALASLVGISTVAPAAHAAILTPPSGGNAGLALEDTTPPVMRSPRVELTLGQLGTATVPVYVSWMASDTNGIKSYSVFSRKDGGEWINQTSRLSSPASFGIVLPLERNRSYLFAIRAFDPAGNASNWSYTRTFTPASYDNENSGVSYSSGWFRATGSAFFRGSMEYTTRVATATLNFTGSSVAWVARKSSVQGKAYVYLDGAYHATVDLYSPSLQTPKVVLHYAWTTSGRHSVKVLALGTSGRPYVNIDAFAVLT
jgi:hypothetical protein